MFLYLAFQEMLLCKGYFGKMRDQMQIHMARAGSEFACLVPTREDIWMRICEDMLCSVAFTELERRTKWLCVRSSASLGAEATMFEFQHISVPELAFGQSIEFWRLLFSCEHRRKGQWTTPWKPSWTFRKG